MKPLHLVPLAAFLAAMGLGDALADGRYRHRDGHRHFSPRPHHHHHHRHWPGWIAPRHYWSAPYYPYPRWLYAPAYSVPLYAPPPVYVERVYAPARVYVERVYEAPAPRYVERSYAQLTPREAPARRAEPKAEPPRSEPPRLQRYTLSATELFEFDKATLKAAQPRLDEIAAALVKNPGIDKVTITGHTDRLGSEAYNLKLSQRRADAVKAYLTRKGVAAHRLTATGKGEAHPVVQCNEKDRAALIKCLEPNRRVEVESITIEQRR